jgi:predicted acyltransferase
VEWEGFHFYDFIFPLFQFLMGVSMVYSIDKRLTLGDTKGRILLHALVRAMWMVVIGFFIHGKLQTWNIQKMQLSYSVLEMLALGYLIAVVLVLYTSLRGQIIAVAVFLIGYWAVQMFIPVEGHEWGQFKRGALFSDWIYNRTIGLLDKPWKSDIGHGFPLVPMWTHGATTMLGVFAARILRVPGSDGGKLKWLVLLGAGCLAAGWLWSWHLPIVKNCWSSSFALWCGGWSYLLLALFWWVIDVKGWRWGLGLWLAIGANSILAYIIESLLMGGFRAFATTFLGNLKPHMGGYWHGILMTLASYGLAWAVLIHLRRHRIHLRI